MEAFRPETVVHLAAMTAVDICESAPEEADRVNALGAGGVAAEAERMGAAILALSTDYVFDGKADRPYREEDPTGPLNVYGRTKLRGEERIREVSSEWTVVRSAWLFGRARVNFVTRILNTLETRDTVRVVDDQTGSPTFTEDLARGLVQLIESDARGLVHLVNRGQATWCDLARRAAEIRGLDPDRVRPASTGEIARPAPRPAYSVLDPARAEDLGVRLRSWEEALAEYLGE